MKEITKKQREYIRDISAALGCEFRGTTRLEAQLWLAKYAPKYEQMRANSEVQ